MTKTDGAIHVMNDKDIEEKIEQYLSVREEEKNKHGEVFTPIELINEMIVNLPPNVWSNPNLKWLDPANGIGNFPMVIFQRLMKGLEKWEPSETKRSKHIIENMLYMIEINPKNVKISRKIFGSNAHICCANFLTNSEKCFKEFGTDNFDIIIGNPPFQDEKSGETAQGGHDIYPNFFIKSFELLNNDGYLSFINPAKWRAPDKKGELKRMWDIFVNNNPIFLKIYGLDKTRQIFRGGAATRIDYYVLQKNTKHKSTVIIDEENKEHNINLRDWAFLPNYDIDTIQKILTDENTGISVIYSSSQYDKRKPYMSIKEKGSYVYPVLHSHTIKDGDIFYWSKTKDSTGKSFVPMFGVSKVILIKGLYPYPYNDYKGKYGMSNYSFGIPITSKKEGDNIVKAINSEGFERLISATKWSSGFTDHNMFKYFKPDFYKHFLKDEQATKIQAITRGRQQRNKSKKQNTKKGGKHKTLKNKSTLH